MLTRICHLALVAVAILPWNAVGVSADTPVYAVDAAGPIDQTLGMRLPSGFSATVFADGLGRARHVAVAPGGVVYVNLGAADANGNGVVALRDTDGDGVADEDQRFSTIEGTGIGVREGHLYVSSDETVYRYPLPKEGLVPEGDPEVIVTGFPKQRAHAAKPLAFDDEGHLFVEVGVPSNGCQERRRTPGSPGRQPCDELTRAGIWRFQADETGQDQMIDGTQVARGLRHAVAMDWHRGAGALFFTMHGRDQLNTLWPDYFDVGDNAEMPAEEFHIVAGDKEYGWPYTFVDPRSGKRLVAPEYGGDGQMEAEAGLYADPLISFPAHWAPNDMLFHSGKGLPKSMAGGAFIAFHGSWNRAPRPQAGYQVVFAPFDAEGRPTGDWGTFADGFAGADPLSSPRDARFRPMGLAEGPDGALYITDSRRGRIWKVVHGG